MSLDVVVDGVAPAQWQTLASSFTDHNVYQTWEFGARRAAEMKAEVSRLVVRQGETTLGMAQVRIKRIPLVRAGMAHILHGPLWRRPGSCASDLQAVLEAISEEYVVRRGLSVRIVPNLADFCADRSVLAAFDKAGFAHDAFTEPYRTSLLDLSLPLDELRRHLRGGSWRRHLVRAEKCGLTVKSGIDDGIFSAFEKLYGVMWARKRFETGVTVSSFRALQQELPGAIRQTVLLALQEGQPVAGHVSHLLGDTCIFLLGASNEEGRKSRASYLLHWHAVTIAKEAGARWYDLGGIDPERNPGVYRFKTGMGGQECKFIGPFCRYAGRSSKYVVPFAERVYRAWRPLRAPNEHMPVRG